MQMKSQKRLLEVAPEPRKDKGSSEAQEALLQIQPAMFVERPQWRMDDRTRAIGRAGVAAARAALEAARERSAA